MNYGAWWCGQTSRDSSANGKAISFYINSKDNETLFSFEKYETIKQKVRFVEADFGEMDLRGFEPLTSSMRTRRAPNCATDPRYARNYNSLFAFLARQKEKVAHLRFDERASGRERKRKTQSRILAAHDSGCLPLLPSAPGGVHRAPSHEAHLSTFPFARSPTSVGRGKGFGSAERIADTGHRYLPT